jgi:hypothetical protein
MSVWGFFGFLPWLSSRFPAAFKSGRRGRFKCPRVSARLRRFKGISPPRSLL